MVHRIETGLREGVTDPRGNAARDSMRGFLGLPVKRVRTRDVFKIDASLSPEEADRVRLEFTDPVIQESVCGALPAADAD